MGKNSDRESLIRLIVNTVVHEIVLDRTNKPESKNFLASEVIEYRSQTEKTAKKHHWNIDDKALIEQKAQTKVKERLVLKYSDISYQEQDIINKLNLIINKFLL